MCNLGIPQVFFFFPSFFFFFFFSFLSPPPPPPPATSDRVCQAAATASGSAGSGATAGAAVGAVVVVAAVVLVILLLLRRRHRRHGTRDLHASPVFMNNNPLYEGPSGTSAKAGARATYDHPPLTQPMKNYAQITSPHDHSIYAQALADVPAPSEEYARLDRNSDPNVYATLTTSARAPAAANHYAALDRPSSTYNVLQRPASTYAVLDRPADQRADSIYSHLEHDSEGYLSVGADAEDDAGGTPTSPLPPYVNMSPGTYQNTEHMLPGSVDP